MRVLYLTQYFFPEAGATQARAHDMAKALVAAGHDVALVCEVPNHPKGRIWPEYRGRVVKREKLDGIDVIRVWVKASETKSYWNRVAFYTSYMMMAILAGLGLARGKFDLVFATSPPLFVAIAGLVVSYARRTPFVMEVRDPWPAAAEALGELRSARVIGAARWLEQRCYARARQIITVSQGWKRHIEEAGVTEDQIILLPNGADLRLFSPRQDEAAGLRQTLNLGDDAFVVLYAGLHGIAQGLEVLIQAADLLRKEPRIRFIFVGEGPIKETLVRQADALDLPNVMFHAEVPRERIPGYLSMADLALVPLRGIAMLRGALPSKLFDAWACCCPVLVVGEGESCDLVEQADGGWSVAPENAPALAATLNRLQHERQLCRVRGQSGRRFVCAHHDREELGRRFVAALEGTKVS